MPRTIAFPHDEAKPIIHALDLLDKQVEKASAALLVLGLPTVQVQTIAGQSSALRTLARLSGKPAEKNQPFAEGQDWDVPRDLLPTLRCGLTLYAAKLNEVLTVQGKLGIEDPADTKTRLAIVRLIEERAREQLKLEFSGAVAR